MELPAWPTRARDERPVGNLPALKLGAIVRLSIGASSGAYEVSGLYRTVSASSPYWWGSDFFGFGTAQTPPPRIDSLFADKSMFSTLPLSDVALGADVPVDTKGLKSTELPSFRHTLSSDELQLGRLGLIATSGIGTYLDDVAAQQRSMTTTIAVIDLQLLLLVLMVLFGIAGRTAAERDQDLALANLRGLLPRSLWAVALREPFALMIAATPLGAGLGWLVALATAHANLLPGTPVPFDSLALGASLAAALVALAATAAGSRPRSVPIGAQLRRVALARRNGPRPCRRSFRHRTCARCCRATVGLRGRNQCQIPAARRAGAGPDRTCRRGDRRQGRATCLPGRRQNNAVLAESRPLPGAAARGRQSGIIRQSVIIAIAVSLSCFAVAGFFVDRANRSEQALFLVGANKVLTVSVPPKVDFEQAVRLADPSGKGAMAAEVGSTSGTTLLAVDTSRLSRVLSWVPQPGAGSSAAVSRYLDPPVAPPVTIEGDSLKVTADLLSALNPRPSLVVGVFNEQYGSSDSVSVGPLDVGRHEYVTSLQGYCTSVCRLQSITASWSGPENGSGSGQAMILVKVEGIAVGSAAKFASVAAGLSHPGSWRVTQGAPGASSSVSNSPGGMLATLDYVVGQAPPVIAPADVPKMLPAVVTNTVASLSGGGPTGSTQYSILNLDGSSLTVNGAMQVAAIPAVGTNAVMVDLGDALRNETMPDIYTIKQVWLSAASGTGATIIRRLAQSGVRVVSVQSARSLESPRLNKTAPHWPSSSSLSWAQKAPSSLRDQCSSPSRRKLAGVRSKQSRSARSACHGARSFERWPASWRSSPRLASWPAPSPGLPPRISLCLLCPSSPVCLRDRHSCSISPSPGSPLSSFAPRCCSLSPWQFRFLR